MSNVYQDNNILSIIAIVLFILLLFFDTIVIILSFIIKTTKNPRLFYFTINVLIANFLLIFTYLINFFTPYEKENDEKILKNTDLCKLQAIILSGLTSSIDLIVLLITFFSYKYISSDYSLENLSKFTFFIIMILPYICPLLINIIVGIFNDYEFNGVFCFATKKKLFNKVSIDILICYSFKYFLLIIAICYIIKINKFLKKKLVDKERNQQKLFILKRFSLLIIQIIGMIPATVIRTNEIIFSHQINLWEFWIIIITYSVCGFLFALVYLWISGIFNYFYNKKSPNNSNNINIDDSISDIGLSNSNSKDNSSSNDKEKKLLKEMDEKEF